MPQRTSYTPPFSSSLSEEEQELRDELEGYCEQVEDFWWDEEERHELF